MRRRIGFKSLLAFMAIGLMLVSCGKNKSASRTTGWEHNDPENGNFRVVEMKEQSAGPGLIFIEGGTFTMGSTTENVYFDWNNTPRQVTVSSFYMDQTEVSNLDYLEYIHWLGRVYGKDCPEMITNALPDTLVWRNSLSYNEPMVEVYFRHPAYRDYPVVGVTWLQANDYALWRSDRVNEKLLVDAGKLSYNNNQNKDNFFSTDAYLAGKYTGIVNSSADDMNIEAEVDSTGAIVTKRNEYNDSQEKANMEDGILLPKYRLPTEAEWEYAALGLIGNTVNERIVERKVYPWNSDGLRTNIPEYYGEFVANFKRGRGDYMGIAGNLKDGAAFPAPVMFYFPNDYGLYNMAGNVSEWVLDVYRPLTYEDFHDHNPIRGNIFTNDTVVAYNLNYRDGDNTSTLSSEDWKPAAEGREKTESYTGQMYDYGETTLISDKSRVYKGGSWADGPFYLSPSVRRFMNEDECASTIGFRCAMNRIGSSFSE